MTPVLTYSLFALECTIFGTTFLMIRIGLLAGASPFFYAGIRFLLAGILLLGTLVVTRKSDFRSLLRISLRSAFISIFLTTATFGCMFWAESRIESGYMARLDAAGPVITAIFAAALTRTSIGRLQLAGFIAGTVGVFLLASRIDSGADPAGVVAAIGSVVSYAVGMALYPRLFDDHVDPLSVNALQMTIGGALLLLIAPFSEKISLPTTPAVLLPLLYLVVAGSMVAHTVNLLVIRNLGAVFASSWLYVAPPLASAAGALFLGESVGAKEGIGTLLALAGCFLISKRYSRRGRTNPSVKRE